jgi:Pin2-interacting protein X1
MGLAEPKRKKKLAPSHHAPSTWSKEAPTSLGFKLMSSMGWSPGQGLGQDLQGEKDNIKYALKDDLLGIGAKKEYGGGLWRGTSEIDDLYKRLDVGSKQQVGVQRQEKVVEEPVGEKVKLRGGWEMKFQVGDTYTSSFSRTETETEGSTPAASGVESPAVEREEKRKKRKREGEKQEKKKKKSKTSNGDTEMDKKERTTVEPGCSKERSKKDKVKDRSKTEKPKQEAKEQLTMVAENAIETAEEQKKEKRKEKKTKHDRKESKGAEEKPEDPKAKKKDHSSRKGKEKATSETAVSTAIQLNTPSHEGACIQQNGSDSDRASKMSRHMHRSRFLAMKKASVLNPEALREILGVSA